VATPAPAVIQVSDQMARLINQSLRPKGYSFSVRAGDAAGCEFIPGLANYTVGQNLTPELRHQASRLFVFDMLSQNPDRRTQKVNCALSQSGLLAFDFELCFAHLFTPIISGAGNAWTPSSSNLARNHLFYQQVKQLAPDQETICDMVSRLTSTWWNAVNQSLPENWRTDADKIWVNLQSVAEHVDEFAKDITGRCLI
jgi:hypothetical protein